MELRHLRYFEAVATELNFRRAAERLHIVQPALSRQIRDLEDELRVRLFDRDTVGVQLTDAGRVFLEEVRQILSHVRSATELTRDAALGRRGRLAIGNIGPVTATFMPECLAAFRVQFPDVAVDLVEVEPAEQVVALERGTVQVAFIVEKNPTLPAHLARRRVVRSPMCAIVGPAHRLARAGRVQLDELAREKLLCFAGQKTQTHADLVRGILSAHGVKSRPLTIVAGFESLLAMIGGGQGVSLMPRHTIAPSDKRVLARPLAERADDLVFEVSAVWRSRPPALLAENFVRVVDAVAIPSGTARGIRGGQRRSRRPQGGASDRPQDRAEHGT
jgi:DNA-binding transcriptional LysR family regulator